MGFKEAGIKVFFDNVSPTVGEVIEKFIRGEIEEIKPENACGVH